MKTKYFLFLFWAGLLFVTPSWGDDCQCEEVKCGPCELQADTKFYTAKCDKGRRVKSCKRPICKPMSPLPKICANSSKKTNPLKAQVTKKKKMAYRKKAIKKYRKIRKPVAVVITSKGQAWVTSESGKVQPVKLGGKVYEEDVIETGKKGKVRVLFKDKNTLSVTPGSKVRVADFHGENSPEDRTLIDLAYGKIRSKVQKKYMGKRKNYYRVRTKAAVAGVRGTDFVVSYFEGESVETQVQTLEGEVALAPRQSKGDEGSLLEADNHDRVAKVGQGQYAKFVIQRDADRNNVFTEDDIQSFVSRGYMTPTHHLTENEIQIITAETDYSKGEARDVASDERTGLCRAPVGAFNSCSWTCVGSDGRSKACDTSKVGVRCVRKRCDANGNWAQEYRLPASQGHRCDGRKTVVRPCDY